MSAEIDGFFEGYPESKRLFEVLSAKLEALGPVQFQVTKSQIAIFRQKALAWVWIPARYLRGEAAPLVLTIALRYRQFPSPRWKEIVEPYPGRFTHHLELFSVAEIDDEVIGWLLGAWNSTA